MNDLSSLSSSIRSFSRIRNRDPDETVEFKDELVSLASELRGQDIPYRIVYARPDKANFRLRSSEPPASDAHQKTIDFLEPGRRLELEMDDVSREIFDGLCAELTILGESDDFGGDSIREDELNLLTSRAFQAELYAEFQRCERYETPLFVVVIDVDPTGDWKQAARELKHIGKRRDFIGLFEPSPVVGVFTSRENDPSFREEFRERLELQYPDDQTKLKIFHIPTDVSEWNELQQKISNFDSSEERDVVGNRGN